MTIVPATAADALDAPLRAAGRPWGAGVALEASRVVAAPPERVFAFLSDLRNHWQLESRFVALGGLDGAGDGPTGGRIRIAGPVGISREATTRVLVAEAPAGGRPGMLAGHAQVGAATVGRVAWEVARHPGGTHVRLAVSVERASRLDRAVLTLGGARWLGRVLTRTLANLAGVLAAVPAA